MMKTGTLQVSKVAKGALLMENRVLLLFCLILLAFVLFQGPLLGALVLGFLLFAGYGLHQGHSLPQVLTMAWEGVLGVRTIFQVFLLIGLLTGVWRSAGTIAYLVTAAGQLIHPALFLLLAFWLNCNISFLLGTSFGTAATMGVITMKIGISLGIPPLFTGGAILSGVYFGDRMSPVSTSALLVAVLTGTNLYRNLRNMARSTLVPFVLSSLFYLSLGFLSRHQGQTAAPAAALASLYTFTPLLLLPALSILVLSLLQVPVKTNLAVSILLASLLSLLVQHMSPAALLQVLVWGYHAPDPSLASLTDGGGILSMVRVGAIVCLSSSYAGIFKGTGLLDGLQERCLGWARKWGCQTAATLTALFTSLIACNQSFTILLTHQLCRKLPWTPEKAALTLEDTAVLLAPLVPWSIACAVVLESAGAPAASIPLACYLYLVPLWNLWTERPG